jgi:hydroxymethylpyrimidine pyrophosphatase-like HAD family hydrolase
MQYFLLACDYDGTLAGDGHIDDATLTALEKFRSSGRRLAMVTGRDLDDLSRDCPNLDLFEWVVAENGALLYQPTTRTERLLTRPVSAEFVQSLRTKGIELGIGKAIVSTWTTNEAEVLKTIHEMGLELQIIFNVGRLMVLPSGVNKASGLKAALHEMRISPQNVVAVGDAENDHALLDFCGAGIAVANAVPMLRWKADLVTEKESGAGVREVVRRLLDNDLADLQPRLRRTHLLLGRTDDGDEVRIPTNKARILIIGPSGAGKSSLAGAIMEQLLDAHSQFCMIDPEGDYLDFEGTISTGSQVEKPETEKVLPLLDDPRHNVVVNLVGVSAIDRPTVFHALLAQLQAMRARTGRPHWIMIDETHHVLPDEAGDLAHLLESLERTIFITLNPNMILPSLLDKMTAVIVLGKTPIATLRSFPGAAGLSDAFPEEHPLQEGECLFWQRSEKRPPCYVRFTSHHTLRRHNRKYVEGKLELNRAFHFRGPDGKLNLPAQNLLSFLQIAQGIDDESWLYHLRRKDYSQWFRECIKDADLAREAAAVEEQADVSPQESREKFVHIIEERYSLPVAELRTPQATE